MAAPPPAGGAPPPPPAAEAPEPVGAPPPQPAPPVPSTAEAPKREQGEWDVVPVFYGTDRAQKPNAERLDYGSERGRRLELGRALVTVPRSHKVPSIERPWAIRVFNVTLYQEAEDPNRHFTMDEIKALTEEEFLTLVRERLAGSARYNDHAFIFVHGYNTSFDYAIYRTAQISYDLKFDGAAFAYSWPSGGGLASYTYDRESSGQAEPYLREFVELVTSKSGAKSVSIIAHSMGNQPTLQVLRDLRRAPPEGVRISQIILAAPDVDRDNFENIARDIQGLGAGVTLYAASNDRALTVSRNFYGGIPRAGDVPPTGPLVLPGIDTIDVSASSMDSLGLNHSGYAENNELLKDIAALIATGTRPPKLRTPALEEVTTAKGAYWRYPAVRP
jgi:esterase/lipase superfamily enzyme